MWAVSVFLFYLAADSDKAQNLPPRSLSIWYRGRGISVGEEERTGPAESALAPRLFLLHDPLQGLRRSGSRSMAGCRP